MKNKKKSSAHSFTKEVLFMALCKLMENKPYDKITIKELAQEAGVSRTTFYRSYHDIEDILLDYFREHPFGAPSMDDFKSENYDLVRSLRDSLTEIREHQALWINLLSAEKDNIIYRVYDETIKTACKTRVFDLGFRDKYELSALAGIYYSLVREWISNGMQESIDEMVDICYTIIHTFYKNDEYAIPSRDDVYQPTHYHR